MENIETALTSTVEPSLEPQALVRDRSKTAYLLSMLACGLSLTQLFSTIVSAVMLLASDESLHMIVSYYGETFFVFILLDVVLGVLLFGTIYTFLKKKYLTTIQLSIGIIVLFFIQFTLTYGMYDLGI